MNLDYSRPRETLKKHKGDKNKCESSRFALLSLICWEGGGIKNIEINICFLNEVYLEKKNEIY